MDLLLLVLNLSWRLNPVINFAGVNYPRREIRECSSLGDLIKSIRGIILELDRVSILDYTKYVRRVRLVVTGLFSQI